MTSGPALILLGFVILLVYSLKFRHKKSKDSNE